MKHSLIYGFKLLNISIYKNAIQIYARLGAKIIQKNTPGTAGGSKAKDGEKKKIEKKREKKD